MTLKMKMIATASVIALAAGVVLPAPAAALDAKQKEEFGAFIKEYLLANPEIMLEVQEALSAKQRAKQQESAQAAIAGNSEAIFNSTHDIALGNPNGDVTIVEFFDYNCGYCKRALSDMDAILAEDKNVRFVLKELPILGPESLAAHKVSAAFRTVAPEKYGDFHRALLGSEERATEETAIAVAAKLGVTEEQLREKMEDGRMTLPCGRPIRLPATSALRARLPMSSAMRRCSAPSARRRSKRRSPTCGPAARPSADVVPSRRRRSLSKQSETCGQIPRGLRGLFLRGPSVYR